MTGSGGSKPAGGTAGPSAASPSAASPSAASPSAASPSAASPSAASPLGASPLASAELVAQYAAIRTGHDGRARALIQATERGGALILVAIALLALLLMVTGQRTGDALVALVRGAAGSWYAISSATLVRTIPLALSGLAVSLAFRAGILNIGVEGQLLAGAAAATFASLAAPTVGVFTLPLLILAGAAAGAAWAGIAAFLRQRFGVLEVISTIMLNYVALHGVGYLVRGPLQERTRIFPQSFPIDVHAQMPIIIPGTRLHAGFLLALVIAFGMWWWLRDRASGFRLRAVGANARAALSAGRINVARTATIAFLASGAIAGVAGASELSGVTYSLYENISPGYGYTAIAVALLARLNPLGVMVTALLFGALEAGASAMQRDAGVPSVLVNVVEALLILLVLAADHWQTRSVRTAEAGT